MTARKRIAIISTGGTIEKTYDELAGVMQNRASVLDVVLATLQLEGVDIVRMPLMNKDSLEMSAQDHTLIATTSLAMAETHDGVVIVHGTDRLAHTGERLVELGATPRVPIVLLAVQVLSPGVYVAMHNKVLQFPGVAKDRERGTFVKPGGADGDGVS
jgi:L-asparaginase